MLYLKELLRLERLGKLCGKVSRMKITNDNLRLHLKQFSEMFHGPDIMPISFALRQIPNMLA